MSEKLDVLDLARLSDEAGVSQRTIRYYIQQGLLPHPGRGRGAHYHHGHLDRLSLIRQWQDEHDLSLAQIRRRLSQMPDDDIARLAALALPRAHGTPKAAEAARSSFPLARTQWDRLALTEDIELHVRRPLSRDRNRRLQRLLREAQRILTDVGAVVLMPASPWLQRPAKEALEALLAAAQPPLQHLEASDALVDIHADREHAGGILSSMGEQLLVRHAASLRPDAAVRVVFTERRHRDNWFSHWHPEQRTVVVSLHDWSRIAGVKQEAFMAYEALLFGMNVLCPDENPLDWVHEETRGCLFDLCRHKREIEIKLETMDICPSCEGQLKQRGLLTQPIRALCTAVRALARGPEA